MTTKKQATDKKDKRPGIQGCNLKRLREARDLTQRGLAELSGVHFTQIANLERGETQEAARDTLERLEAARKRVSEHVRRPVCEQSASPIGS